MDIGMMMPAGFEPDEKMKLAEKADSLGVELLLVGEANDTNVFVDLTNFALHTSDVKIGAGIANVFSRSPSLIAQSTAELDRISDGRLVLGLGASTKPLVEQHHGLRFEKPVQRISEYIDIIKSGWGGEAIQYDGQFFSPSGGRIKTPPIQDDPPIAIAALGRRNRQLTGAKADMWFPHLVPGRVIDDLATDIYTEAAEHGRSTADIRIAAYVPTAVAEERADAREQLRGHIASYVGAAESYQRIIARGGYEEQAREIYQAWQSGNRSAARERVSTELIDDVGIATTSAGITERIDEWVSAEVDILVVHFPPRTSVEQAMTTLDSIY